MDPDFEDILESKNTPAEVHCRKKNPGLPEALRDSMEQPIKFHMIDFKQ